MITPNRRYKLIQISDLHLQQCPDERYQGVDVEQRLLAVLQHVQNHHADFDGLILSGDLVHHGHAEGYRRLSGYLHALAKPWCWIPGNHDSTEQMQSIKPTPSPSLVLNGWRLVLLDSCADADGRGAGSLAESELDRLATELELAQTLGQPVVVVLHHNPLPLGSGWQDAIMLGNADLLWALLGRYQISITLLFGHTHQQQEQHHQGVRLLGCPSTAVQFKAQQATMMLETDPLLASPGYRWLTLPFRALDSRSTELDRCNTNRLQLETGVERICLA